MKELFDKLLEEGETALELMVSNSQEETLHLEFKTAAGDAGNKLTKDDKNNIAKALSGFSNAEGGILLIGVRTSKVDNLDTAIDLQPITNIESYRNRVASYVHDAISPLRRRTAHRLRRGRLVSEDLGSEPRSSCAFDGKIDSFCPAFLWELSESGNEFVKQHLPPPWSAEMKDAGLLLAPRCCRP